MPLGLIGKKIGMGQLYNERGERVPVTVIQAGPCTILDVKTRERHGYEALRLAYDSVPERKIGKARAGEFKKRSLPPMRTVGEFRTELKEEYKSGAVLSVEVFSAGEMVQVHGVSKGKGFQGGIKRHGFGGGPAAHGHKFHREIGSVGMHAQPHKVPKGRKMPGHMGAENVTLKSVTVVAVVKEQNLLLVRGSVPGGNGNLVVVEKN